MDSNFGAGSGMGSPNPGDQDQGASGGRDFEGMDEALIQQLNAEREADEARLHELMTEINQMRIEAAEEDAEIAELEEYCRSLRGRIAATNQSTEELGVEPLKEMLANAQAEYENGKLEYDELSREMLSKSASVITDVQDATSEIQTLRMQVMNPETLQGLIQEKEDEIQALEEEEKTVNAETEKMEAAIEDLEQTFQAFEDIDHVAAYLEEENVKLDAQIDEARTFLAVKRGDYSGGPGFGLR